MLDKSKLTKSGITAMEPLIEGNNLFVKGGISVISSLAGVGKTTYCLQLKNQLEKDDYNVVYFNADYAPMDIDDVYKPMKVAELVEYANEATDEDVIIIDSLKSYSALNDLDVMDNKDMMSLFLEFRGIVVRTGCSIVLVHHSFKEKKLKTAPEHLFGARAIEEQCDSAFLYSTLNTTVVKNRLGLIRDTILDTPSLSMD